MAKTDRPFKPPLKPLRRALQMLIRRWLWGMDIHPSALISATAYIDRTWPKGVHIGAGSLIDEEAVILTHDMTRGLYLDTHIGRRSYIGPRAIVLPGVTVGEGAMVGPGAIATKDVPDGARVAGNPAREVEED